MTSPSHRPASAGFWPSSRLGPCGGRPAGPPLAGSRRRPALIILASVSPAAIVGLALVSQAAWMFSAVLLAGFTTAPLEAFLRAVGVRALPPGGQATAPSLDAVTTEVLFVAGPTGRHRLRGAGPGRQCDGDVSSPGDRGRRYRAGPDGVGKACRTARTAGQHHRSIRMARRGDRTGWRDGRCRGRRDR